MYRPSYTITNNLLSSISQIEAARQIIDNAPLVPYWERKFQDEALVRSAHHSTHIEGNELEYSEARKIVEGEEITTFRKRDVREVINYRNVLEFIRSEKIERIEERVVKQIHKVLMEDILKRSEAGNYRGKKVVVVSSKTHEISHEPPEPDEVEGEMGGFFEWLNSEYGRDVHPVIRAGILQYEIFQIQPFLDGNKRTARILSTLSLFIDKYDIQKFFSLEEYYDQNVSDYFKALFSVADNDDDMTEWLEFFARGLAAELNRIKKKVLELSKDVKLRKKMGQIALTDRQVQLMNFMEKNGLIRNQDWQELLPDVSDDTVLRDLKGLIEKRLVRKRGRTKAAYYELV